MSIEHLYAEQMRRLAAAEGHKRGLPTDVALNPIGRPTPAQKAEILDRRDRIEKHLKEHGPATGYEIADALGFDVDRTLRDLSNARRIGRVVTIARDGTRAVYALAGGLDAR